MAINFDPLGGQINWPLTTAATTEQRSVVVQAVLAYLGQVQRFAV